MVEVDELELNNYYLLSYEGDVGVGEVGEVVIFAEINFGYSFKCKILFEGETWRGLPVVNSVNFVKRGHNRRNFLLDQFEVNLYNIILSQEEVNIYQIIL